MNNSFIARLITALVTAVLLISLTGCESTDEFGAYDLYSSAIEKINNIGGFETNCVITLSFDDSDFDFDQSFDMNIKRNGKDSQTTTGITGEEKSSVVTRLGDTVYQEGSSYAVKSHITPYSPADNSSLFLDGKLPKNIFKGVNIINGEDGRSTISVHLDNKNSNQLLAGALGVEQPADTKLSNMILSFTFNEKNDFETMQFICDITYDDMDKAKVVANYTFVNFGTAPNITLSHPKHEYKYVGNFGAEDGGIFDWF